MKVHNASRRMLDCYMALLEGFYPAETPYGPVLAPEGLAGDGWVWRPDVRFDSMVASYTRDYETGLRTLARFGICVQSLNDDALENAVIELLQKKFGEDLPPIKGMPKAMRRKKKAKK